MAGLKVVCPGSVADAYGLLRSAIEDDDPVSSSSTRRSTAACAASGPSTPPPHRPRRDRRAGRDGDVLTYGAGVDLALRAAAEPDVEVLDLRTIWPLDEPPSSSRREDLACSCCRRRRARAVSPGHVASLVAREAFELLDAPPALIAPPDTPVPYAPSSRTPTCPRRNPCSATCETCLPTDAETPTTPAEPAAEAPDVPRDTRLALFRLVLLQRLMEERIITLYRQGRIPGSVYTGRGQEAVAAGAGLALGPDDVVAPLNREMATHLARGVKVAHVFRQFLGRAGGPTGGRDGNMHFGVRDRNIFPLVSMLGNLCPVTVGAALAFKRRGEARVAMTFFGDGALSIGDVHEGLNLGGVLGVPAVFVIQNNQFAYSTPTARQMRNTTIAERVEAAGRPCARVDGTDALAVYETVARRGRAGAGRRRAAGGRGADAAHGRPRGARRRALRDAALKEEFATRWDPVERLAARLLLDGLPAEEVDGLRAAAATEVAEGLAEAEAAPPPDPATLTQGVYATPL